MTDNRMTELRKLLDERGIEYAELQDRFRTRFRFNYCEACQDYLNEIEVIGACITASKSYLTPEQAIAATLGSDDRYDAGFTSGVQAVFQQLEGIEDYEELQCFIAEYRGEGEGYDER